MNMSDGQKGQTKAIPQKIKTLFIITTFYTSITYNTYQFIYQHVRCSVTVFGFQILVLTVYYFHFSNKCIILLFDIELACSYHALYPLYPVILLFPCSILFYSPLSILKTFLNFSLWRSPPSCSSGMSQKVGFASNGAHHTLL